jgi:hypothetical protein
MNAVDEFVIYDNIEFTKKGWINRNRILVNGNDSFITIPVKKDSDYLDIRDRFLAEIWSLEKKKILNRIIASYKKAPNFESVYPIIEKCFFFEEDNLFNFIFNSLTIIKEYLEIKTPFLISSTLSIEHALKGYKKVIAICKTRKTDLYLNPIGGIELYRKDDFKDEGIDLYFLEANDVRYKQFNNEFVPWLSIIDVMMFNSKEEIMKMLTQYILR